MAHDSSGHIFVQTVSGTTYGVEIADLQQVLGRGVNDLGADSATKRWANIYGVNADLSGDLALAQTSHIDIGPLRIEYDSATKALHITKKSNSDTNNYGIYADGFVAAGGVQQNS